MGTNDGMRRRTTGRRTTSMDFIQECYRRTMRLAVSPVQPQGFARVLGWRRVTVVLCACLALSLVMLPGWNASVGVLVGRWLFVGLAVLIAFGLFERWPAQLPPWLARWALQVLVVAISVPVAVLVAYSVTTVGDPEPWWQSVGRWAGFLHMTVAGLLVAPWMAVAALVRQISGAARNQALAFELERSELERRALDARLRLLQAQTEPHFLFNTLANVRELVDTGSPRASAVLGSLIAYLRATVPRLHEPSSTLELEFDLVRAYLEVMQMRMPDRLQFALHADEEALQLYCPQLTLLTLVENAVRHGIDPSEKGGRIDVRARVEQGRCRAEVVDTGVGLEHSGNGAGIGLSNLLERLQLAFGGDVELQLSALEPHGVRAELDFPASRRAV